ncbi:MAG: hypothetical protein E7J78_11470 [Pantoea sp.]|nr:hypothetical protein [Pantoea sp.]
MMTSGLAQQKSDIARSARETPARSTGAGFSSAVKAWRPCGPGTDGADAPSLSLRLRFLSPGRCLTVFSLCFLLLSVLLCCSCFAGFLSHKVKSINSLMAPSGSPALPGRQLHCANRLCR